VFALRRAGFRDAVRATHTHIAPSRWVRDLLIQEGVAEDRVHVVAPAVPRPRRRAVRPDAGRARFVYAGDLRHAKGPDLVVAAMQSIDPDQGRLEVHGGSPAPPASAETEFERSLEETAKGLPVTFHGRFESEALAMILDRATALIVPSRVRETFGRTANLAWQLGVPVIAADHGALAERVIEGRNGALFAPGDAHSLAQALQRIVRGTSGRKTWPRAADVESCVDALLPHYGGRR
jgi:glycosyltransferase involved in cell wall biosynthesis